MIHPHMATMLAVITTDAAAPAHLLQEWLTQAVSRTFNRISVDGDTSTNDTVLLLANGASGVEMSEQLAVSSEQSAVSSEQLPVTSDQSLNLLVSQSLSLLFPAALHHVCLTLAQMIVRDGEGATKVAEIRVTGTADEDDAHRIAETIATSPLFKTALAGGDANWGRIVAAAGRAGIPFDPQSSGSDHPGGDRSEPLTIFADGMPTLRGIACAASNTSSSISTLAPGPAVDHHLDLRLHRRIRRHQRRLPHLRVRPAIKPPGGLLQFSS